MDLHGLMHYGSSFDIAILNYIPGNIQLIYKDSTGPDVACCFSHTLDVDSLYVTVAQKLWEGEEMCR